MRESFAPGEVCPNCSTPVTGPYCAQCGQRQGVVQVSLRRILADALEDQFNVNAALPRTLKSLLIPGALTREYLSHRIARYIPPVRLYLISSVIFFLLLSFFSHTDRIHFGPPAKAAADSASITLAAADSTETPAAEVGAPQQTKATGQPRVGIQVDLDGGKDAVDVNLGNERLNHYFEQRIETLSQMPQDQMFRALADGFFEHAPKVVFILLPIFALLLKVLYFRRYYVEHFIFALHLHAFTFAVFTVVLVLPDSIPYVSGLLLAWIPLYTLIAMRRVYGQDMIRTLFKWWTLGVSYFVLLIFGVVGALLAALATV